MAQSFVKDVDSVLDYKFDWSEWLAASETISTHTVTVDTGLTKDSDEITDTNTSVTVWLSGGTAGQKYKVNCEIVTNQDRTDQRTIVIKAVN
jgi:CTP synthase (UTP-ammonia lyase)